MLMIILSGEIVYNFQQIGTYQIAVLAKSVKKPFYALAESYKFVRLFPLNQYDLPTVLSSSSQLMSKAEKDETFSLLKAMLLKNFTFIGCFI